MIKNLLNRFNLQLIWVVTSLIQPGAMEVEKVHEGLYRKALQALEAKEDVPAVEYYVCPVCGFTHEGPLEGKCPVCGTPAERFERMS